MSAIPIAGAITIVSDQTDAQIVASWLQCLRVILGLTNAVEWPDSHWTQEAQCRRLREMWKTSTGFKDFKGAKRAGLNNHFWGPVFWQSLHDVAAMYTPENHMVTCKIFQLLPFVLPCRTCRRHVIHLLQKFRKMMNLADSRAKWVNLSICMHNTVSMRVKGPLRAKLYTLISPDEAVTVKEALKLVRQHGLSTRAELGQEEEKDCGCREKAIQEGRVPT